MKSITLFFLCFIFFVKAEAQQKIIQERTYLDNSSQKFIANSVPDGQGNIMYSGLTFVSVANYNSTFLFVKANADTLWSRNGPNNLEHSIQGINKLRNGYLFYAPKSHPSNNGTGALLQRLNAFGQPVWTQTHFDNSTDNIPQSVLTMPDKGYLAGGSFSVNGVTKNFALARTDSSGNILWKKEYTRSIQDDLVHLQFTTSGNILATGTTSNPIGPRHFKLMLLNQNGDSLQGTQLVVSGLNRLESLYADAGEVKPLSDGGFLITALTDTIVGSVQRSMGMLVKIDANLQLQWKYVHRTNNLPIEEFVFSNIRELTDGSLLVSGYKSVQSAGGSNGFQLYHFSQNGQLINTFPFTSNICTQVMIYTLDNLSDTTFLMAGRCYNNSTPSYGFYVAKVKISGVANVLPPLIISGTNEDLVLQESGLGQSYPNPTAAETNIPYNLPKNYRQASIIIREIATGREVKSYLLKRNESSLKVDLSNFSNGLYLYSLIVDEKPVATRKLAVMK